MHIDTIWSLINSSALTSTITIWYWLMAISLLVLAALPALAEGRLVTMSAEDAFVDEWDAFLDEFEPVDITPLMAFVDEWKAFGQPIIDVQPSFLEREFQELVNRKINNTAPKKIRRKDLRPTQVITTEPPTRLERLLANSRRARREAEEVLAKSKLRTATAPTTVAVDDTLADMAKEVFGYFQDCNGRWRSANGKFVSLSLVEVYQFELAYEQKAWEETSS